MPVPAVRAGDVVVDAKGLADANRNCFFSAVKMRQAGHQSTGVEFIDLLFKHANPDHLLIRAQPFFFLRRHTRSRLRLGGRGAHCFLPPVVTGVETPDMAASTSNMQAKSYFVQPIPRAAVRNSLLAAVVGKGTSSWRPRSIASTMSFCIMLTSNHASSGCCSTNGPRY